MSRRKRSFRPGLWLLLAALIALLVVAGRPNQPLQVRRLPDGSTLSLEAITYGPKSRFVPGGPLRGILSALIPERLRYQAGLSSFTQEAVGPRTPVVWMTRRRGKTRAMRGPYDQNELFDWTLVDEHGCERPTGEVTSWHSPPREVEVISFALHAYPKRGAWVGLRLYSPGMSASRKVLAEFRIPNPSAGSYPKWVPQALPISVRDGDLECTLHEFTNGCDSYDPMRATWMGRVFGSNAFVQVESHFLGTGPTRWTPIDVTFEDATGNRYERQGMGKTSSHANKSRLWAPWMLPFCEPAWKVEVELARTPGSPFRPEELWTVENIPAPDWGQVIDVNRSTTIDGVTVMLRGLTRGTPAFLNAHLDTGEAGHCLTLVKMVDDRGRPVIQQPHWNSAWRTRGGWASYQYFMTLRGGSKSFTATFALQKTRRVEFLAAPKHLISPPARQ